MEIQQILQELDRLRGHHFPREALEAAIERREEITPHLLQILKYIRESFEDIHDDYEYMAHLYAMYLLAQFREKRAFPLIVDYLSMPGEEPADFLSDTLTEGIPAILGSVYDGNADALTDLVLNRDLYEFTRTAALSTFLVLLVSGQISRDEVIERYRFFYREGLEREYSYVWDGLAYNSAALYPEELMVEIKEAHAAGYIDSHEFPLSFFEETFQEGKEVVLKRLESNRHNHIIEDAIGAMEWWACFKEPRPYMRTPARPEMDLAAGGVVLKSGIYLKTEDIPGRNDPCPCGSGKKYKKCCGRAS